MKLNNKQNYIIFSIIFISKFHSPIHAADSNIKHCYNINNNIKKKDDSQIKNENTIKNSTTNKHHLNHNNQGAIDDQADIIIKLFQRHGDNAISLVM